jgi:hypothetical protein
VSLLGIHLTVLAGPTVPVPLPVRLLESLESAEVKHTDEGRSGFQLVFKAGRASTDLVESPLLSLPALAPFARVILLVAFGPLPKVLMDGIITNRQLTPGKDKDPSKLTITGEDVSVMMDREEKSVEHPAQPELAIALKIIGSYARFGLIPLTFPPPSIDVPLPIERTPVQQGTDLAYLTDLARRFNFVFYVEPGPAPGTNTAYWGPQVRPGLPQPALSVNLGQNSNVTSIDFQQNALDPTTVQGKVQDRTTNKTVPVKTLAGSRPPLAAQPPDPTAMQSRAFRESGITASQALSRAQAATDESLKQVVTASGELDALQYGGILNARGLVGLRGAGLTYDGLYYVKNVTHTIQPGQYHQRFELTREGTGSIVPAVRP